MGAAPLVRAKLQQVFGATHAQRGEFGLARTALQEALTAQRELVGPDHPDALESLLALGQAMRDAAQSLLLHVLELRRCVLPANHPDLALTLGTLAEHHRRRGELERSRELYRQAPSSGPRVSAATRPPYG